ncbi:MAG: hypothetical protein AB7F32_04980 [Victivallaceae bacterium]
MINPEQEAAWHKIAPAPTLAELLDIIREASDFGFQEDGFLVNAELYHYPLNATAALRLLMRVKGGEV